MRGKLVLLIVALAAVIGTGILTFGSAQAHPMSGAIFTTLPDGSVVNGNIYEAKCDVALNGGPRSPQSHHLPDGKYDVAVTDPSGKTVLGVGEGRVTIANGAGTFGPISLCALVTPSPYDTTPNNGGEYKAWLCTAGQLFVHRECKTDNFKVRPSAPPAEKPTPTPPPTALVPPAQKSPTPEAPKFFPDTGGEPPTDKQWSETRSLTVTGAGITALALATLFGHLVEQRRRR